MSVIWGIMVDLRTVLKQVNPNIVLDCGGERHRAKNWHFYLTSEWLGTGANVNSNIYNKGKIKIVARINKGTTVPHLIFHQIPLNSFTKKHG